jgi:hypothetical protein
LEDVVYDNATAYTNDTYDTYEDEDAYGYGDGYDAKKKGPVPLDYSVLSIGILTLGLILFVEITRHWIDHQAHGKPFFNAVLLMLYSERTCRVNVLVGSTSPTVLFILPARQSMQLLSHFFIVYIFYSGNTRNCRICGVRTSQIL